MTAVELAQRARILAAEAGIILEWVGEAGPEYDMAHAGLCFVARLGGPGGEIDSLRFQDVLDLSQVLEFGCNWDSIEPDETRSLHRPIELRAFYTRAIPVSALPELIVCLERYLQAGAGIVPEGYEIRVRRFGPVAVGNLICEGRRIVMSHGWNRFSVRKSLAVMAWRAEAGLE